MCVQDHFEKAQATVLTLLLAPLLRAITSLVKVVIDTEEACKGSGIIYEFN